jgi:hypothetical protein
VFGLNDYNEAGAAICDCPGPVQDPSCEETVSSGLAKASASDREKWLENFVEDECTNCNMAVHCYNRRPVCANKAVGCECCVYNHDDPPTCSGSECVICQTCSEVISVSFPDVVPDTMNVCADSKRKLNDLADCVCSACVGACGELCNTGALNAGCALCVQQSNCSGYLDTCQSDVRLN